MKERGGEREEKMLSCISRLEKGIHAQKHNHQKYISLNRRQKVHTTEIILQQPTVYQNTMHRLYHRSPTPPVHWSAQRKTGVYCRF